MLASDFECQKGGNPIATCKTRSDMNYQLECIKIRTTANRSTKIRTDGSLNLLGDGGHVGEPRFLGGRVSMTKRHRV